MPVLIEPPAPPYVGPPRNYGSRTNKPIYRIVIHCTAGTEPGVTGAARGTARYLRETTRNASAHYAADSRESVQILYDSYVGYHAPPNSHSIGYELCCSLSNGGRGHWDREDHRAMLRIAAKDCAQLALAYSVPIRKLSVAQLRAGAQGFCGHDDVRDAFGQTDHWDPSKLFPWGWFMDLVEAEADKLTSTPVPPVPPEKDVDDVKLGARFWIGHVSGKWSASEDTWRRVLGAAAERCSVMAVTETTRDGLLERVVPKGWRFARLDEAPGQSECSVLWAERRWAPGSPAYATRLATTQWENSSGRLMPPVTAITVPLVDRLNEDLEALIIAKHAPSSVEGKTGFKDATPARRRAYAESVDAVREAADLAREFHPGAARVVSADWNLDYRLPWVRRWWAQEFPGLTPAWVGGLPELGTHGGRGRVIDWPAAGRRLQVLRSVVIDAPAPNSVWDHNLVFTRMAKRIAIEQAA